MNFELYQEANLMNHFFRYSPNQAEQEISSDNDDLEGGEGVNLENIQIDENVFTCGICYEDYDMENNSVEIKMLEQCNHTFCGNCFEEFFRALIED